MIIERNVRSMATRLIGYKELRLTRASRSGSWNHNENAEIILFGGAFKKDPGLMWSYGFIEFP